MTMLIKTIQDFNEALERGPYAWPGGYPCYFLMTDCEPLSFEAAKENADLIRDALRDDDKRSGWHVYAVDINWEDPELYCADSGKRIPYGSDA